MIMRLLMFMWSVLHASNGLKILVYQTALSRSHLIYAGSLVDILVDAGHEVHELIANWNPTIVDNGTKKATSLRRFTLSKPSPWLKINHFNEPFTANVINYHMDSREAALHWQTVAEFCEEMLSDESLMLWLRDANFDAVVSTTYDLCAFGLFHVAAIKPVLGFLATPLSDIVLYVLGISNPASYTAMWKQTIPFTGSAESSNPATAICHDSMWPNTTSFISSSLNTTHYVSLSLDVAQLTGSQHIHSFYPSGNGDEMNFLQRAYNLYIRTLMQQIYIPRFIAMQDEIFHKKFDMEMPSLQTLFAQMSYLFVNANEMIDYPRPISPKIVFIGGITRNESKQLPQEYDRILSSHPAGAVLFSFGSVALTTKMPEHVKQAFLEAFPSFAQFIFMWKFDGPYKGLKNISNVYFSEWLPQKQLLRDSRVKAFITHVGVNSLMEAISEGIPVIGIPLFADQIHNAGLITKRHIGVVLDKRNLTAQNIRNALREVLLKDCYRQRAKILSEMVQRNPKKPNQTFLKYVEFAAQFPDIGEYLQLHSTNLNAVEFLY